MRVRPTGRPPINARLVAEAVVAVVFLIIVATVFQQIATDMTDQGIASGGAYNNAAGYPRALAIAIAVLLAMRLVLGALRRRRGTAAPDDADAKDIGSNLGRAAALLVLFALYLLGLGTLGYLLSSLCLVVAVLFLCGERRLLWLILVPLIVTFGLSAVFGGLVNVVLPRGQFGIALPW